jgi:mono/diheme cytochrome c family protein
VGVQHANAMKKLIVTAVLMCGCSAALADAPETPAVTPEQIKKGAALYAQHCAPCHGVRMKDPEGAFDLSKFPPDEHERFMRSVTKGKNSMPPWGGLLQQEEIAALWAYVVAGEKN